MNSQSISTNKNFRSNPVGIIAIGIILLLLIAIGFVFPVLEQISGKVLLTIDSKTLVLANIFIGLTLGLLIIQHWFRNKQGFNEALYWSSAMFLFAISFALLLIRPWNYIWIVRFISFVIANCLLLMAIGIITLGLRTMLGEKVNGRLLIVIVAINAIVMFFYGVTGDNIRIRVVTFSVAAGILVFENVWVLIKSNKMEERYFTQSIILVMSVVGLFFIFRAVAILSLKEVYTVTGNSSLNAATFMIITIWIMIWSFQYMFLYSRKLERALELSNENLQISNQTKDKLFYIIAHDLKNPLGTLAIFFDHLKSQDKISNEDLEQLITIGHTASHSSLGLLDNLLEWAKAQKDLLKFEPRTFRLSEIVNELIPLHQAAVDKKQISLSFDEQKDALVLADRNMVATILRNILSNAVKYTPVNGDITISLDSSGSMAQITISDSGIGMTKEQIDGLNHTVVNHSRIGTAGEKGSGLGLVIVKDFLERIQGEMLITSKPGEGTTIRINLPVA
ncbi:MAG: HAMP domain-containing sensor histidine kinase [Bacteroidales bacterium]